MFEEQQMTSVVGVLLLLAFVCFTTTIAMVVKRKQPHKDTVDSLGVSAVDNLVVHHRDAPPLGSKKAVEAKKDGAIGFRQLAGPANVVALALNPGMAAFNQWHADVADFVCEKLNTFLMTGAASDVNKLLRVLSDSSDNIGNFVKLAMTRVAGVDARGSDVFEGDDLFELCGLVSQPHLHSKLFPPGVLIDQASLISGAWERFLVLALRRRVLSVLEMHLDVVGAGLGSHATFVLNALCFRSPHATPSLRTLQQLIARAPEVANHLSGGSTDSKRFHLRLQIVPPAPTPSVASLDALAMVQLASLPPTVSAALLRIASPAMAFVAYRVLERGHSLVGSAALYHACGVTQRKVGDLDISLNGWDELRTTEKSGDRRARRHAAASQFIALARGWFGDVDVSFVVSYQESCVSVEIKATDGSFKVDFVDPVGSAAAPLSLVHNLRLFLQHGELSVAVARADPYTRGKVTMKELDKLIKSKIVVLRRAQLASDDVGWRRAAVLHEAGFVVKESTQPYGVPLSIADQIKNARLFCFKHLPFTVDVSARSLRIVAVPSDMERNKAWRDFLGVNLVHVHDAAACVLARVEESAARWSAHAQQELEQAALQREEAFKELLTKAVVDGVGPTTRRRALEAQRIGLVVVDSAVEGDDIDLEAAGDGVNEHLVPLPRDEDDDAGTVDNGASVVVNDPTDADAVSQAEAQRARRTDLEAVLYVINTNAVAADFLRISYGPRCKRLLVDLVRQCDAELAARGVHVRNISTLTRLVPYLAHVEQQDNNKNNEPSAPAGAALAPAADAMAAAASTSSTSSSSSTVSPTRPKPRASLVNVHVFNKLLAAGCLVACVDGEFKTLSPATTLAALTHFLFSIDPNRVNKAVAKAFIDTGTVPQDAPTVARPVLGFAGDGGFWRWCIDGVRLGVDKVRLASERSATRKSRHAAKRPAAVAQTPPVRTGSTLPVAELLERSDVRKEHRAARQAQVNALRAPRPVQFVVRSVKVPKKPSDVFSKGFVASMTFGELGDMLKTNRTPAHVVRVAPAERLDGNRDMVKELLRLAPQAQSGDEQARQLIGELLHSVRVQVLGSDSPVKLKIVVADPGAGLATFTISDTGKTVISIDVNDKANISFLRGSVTRRAKGRAAKARRSLQAKQAFENAVLDIVSREHVGGGPVMLLLGDKYERVQHTFVLRCLQRKVTVVHYDEDFTSQECGVHHVYLEPVVEKRVQFVCADAFAKIAANVSAGGGGGSGVACARPPVCAAAVDGPIFEPTPSPSAPVSSSASASASAAQPAAAAAAATAARVVKLGFTKAELNSAQRVSESPMAIGDRTFYSVPFGARLALDDMQRQHEPERRGAFANRVIKLENRDRDSVRRGVDALVAQVELERGANLTARERVEAFFYYCTDTKWGEPVYLESRRNEREVLHRLARIASDEWSRKGNAGDVDAGHAVRAQSFWLPLSQFTTKQLRERRTRWLARLRCDVCGTAAQRCSECLVKRAIGEVRLKCAGSGLCECELGATKLKSVAQLADTYRIEHKVESWRRKHCPGIPGQPETAHELFRDIGSTTAIAMLAHVQLTSGGRPAAFCHKN